MKSKIPYIEWRSRVEMLTPQELRIGDDLLVIEQSEMIDMVNKPVKADATTAIIYDRGSALLSINMREIRVEAPSMVVILQDSTFYAIKNSRDISFRAVVMSKQFTDSLFSDIQNGTQLKRSVFNEPVFLLSENHFIYNQYMELLTSLLHQKESPYRLEAAKHLTLAMFYGYSFSTHNLADDLDQNSNSKQAIYHQFVALLNEHYTVERSVGFYADKLCITPKYLSEVLKEITGSGAITLIHTLVVNECKALLYSTNKTIQEISDMMNFSTQSEFGKFFKRHAGVSPKDYRNNSLK